MMCVLCGQYCMHLPGSRQRARLSCYAEASSITHFAPHFFVIVLIVLSAFLLGKFQSDNASSIENQTAQVLTLLEDNSASKRILAVTSAEDFTNKDTKIIEALINRLFFDKNTNVRLAAAEALSKFSSEAMVRDALIKSLETDKNTSVQIEVITILSKIQEKRAIKPMEKMLENEETPQYVKQQLQLN